MTQVIAEVKEFKARKYHLTRGTLGLVIAFTVLFLAAISWPRQVSVSADDPVILGLVAFSIIAFVFVLPVLKNRERDKLRYVLAPEAIEAHASGKKITVPYQSIRKVIAIAEEDRMTGTVKVTAAGAKYRFLPQDFAKFVDELGARTGSPVERVSASSRAKWTVIVNVLLVVIASYFIWSIVHPGRAAAIGLVVTGVAAAAVFQRRMLEDLPDPRGAKGGLVAGVALAVILAAVGYMKYSAWRESPMAAIDRATWSLPLSEPIRITEPADVTLAVPAGWRCGVSRDELGTWIAASRTAENGKETFLLITVPDKRVQLTSVPTGSNVQFEECQQTAARAIRYAARAYRGGGEGQFVPLGYKELAGQGWYTFKGPSVLAEGAEAVTFWQPTRSSVLAVTFERTEQNDPAVRALLRLVRITR